MINALHLFWIIPVSMIGGFLLSALLTAGSTYDDQRVWREDSHEADADE